MKLYYHLGVKLSRALFRLLLFLAFCLTAFGQKITTTIYTAARPSLLPVHAGVSLLAMGEFCDWATSWKQPEANPLLADKTGTYSGQLYRTGSYRKLGLTAGMAAVAYAVAWKWPRSRKAVGWITAGLGYVSLGVAVSNVARNPYYR